MWRVSLLLVIVLAACSGSPPASSPSVGGPASASSAASASPPEATATASVSEAPSASAVASPEAPTEAVEVGGLVRTTVDRLRIRESPGTEAFSLGTLAEGEIGYVVEGPVAADGFDWFLISALGLPLASGCTTPISTNPFGCPVWFGWTAAAGSDGDPWLVPGSIDCPDWPSPLITDDFLYGVQQYGYLSCFGDEVRSVVGFYPEIPDDAGLGGACAEVPPDLAWIGCNLGYEHIVSDPSVGFLGAGFVLAIDPASGVEMPARGQWVEVAGRYDHPAAQACTWGEPPEKATLACRAQFVVESARVASAP